MFVLCLYAKKVAELKLSGLKKLGWGTGELQFRTSIIHMPKIPYVYQKQEQKLTNIHVMKIHLKYEVKIVEGRINWEPKMGSKCNR